MALAANAAALTTCDAQRPRRPLHARAAQPIPIGTAGAAAAQRDSKTRPQPRRAVRHLSAHCGCTARLSTGEALWSGIKRVQFE
jgi:hypothetical protein